MDSLQHGSPAGATQSAFNGVSGGAAVVAAITEIGGASLVWLGVKEHKGILYVLAGALICLEGVGVITVAR